MASLGSKELTRGAEDTPLLITPRLYDLVGDARRKTATFFFFLMQKMPIITKKAG